MQNKAPGEDVNRVLKIDKSNTWTVVENGWTE